MIGPRLPGHKRRHRRPPELIDVISPVRQARREERDPADLTLRILTAMCVVAIAVTVALAIAAWAVAAR